MLVEIFSHLDCDTLKDIMPVSKTFCRISREIRDKRLKEQWKNEKASLIQDYEAITEKALDPDPTLRALFLQRMEKADIPQFDLFFKEFHELLEASTTCPNFPSIFAQRGDYQKAISYYKFKNITLGTGGYLAELDTANYVDAIKKGIKTDFRKLPEDKKSELMREVSKDLFDKGYYLDAFHFSPWPQRIKKFFPIISLG